MFSATQGEPSVVQYSTSLMYGPWPTYSMDVIICLRFLDLSCLIFALLGSVSVDMFCYLIQPWKRK